MNSESKLEPRHLEFSDLDEVIAEARRLHESGYTQTGKWDLSQICGHVEDWMRFPVEGFPQTGIFMKFMLWMLKVTIGKSSIRKILAQKAMGQNAPTMPQTVKDAGLASEEEAIASLAKAARQFSEHQGDYLPSPVFGNLSRDEAKQLQLIHAAHHLGHLIPK